MDNCQSCKFFSLGERMGLCKRYPQSLNKSNDDFCGEWQIKESLALEALVQLMVDPIIAIDPPKKRGRPAKR